MNTDPGMAGFTFVEMVMVIAVMGILGSMVAVFIPGPMQNYLVATRRAELADTANTALLRIAREVRAAVPNSLRVTTASGRFYLEFLPMSDAGRYRTGGGDALDFTSGSDTSFDVLGPPVNAAAGQFLVVYNLGTDDKSNAYRSNSNRRGIPSGNSGNPKKIDFTATGNPLPLESPDKRFFVADPPVTYVCDPAAGTVRRYSGYAIQEAQPADVGAAPLSGATVRLLADHVSDCRFIYDLDPSQRLSQLTLRMQLSLAGETVSLYREVVVIN